MTIAIMILRLSFYILKVPLLSAFDIKSSATNYKVVDKMCVLPGVDFINVLRTTFTTVAPQSIKTQVKLSVYFYAFGIYERESCT